jgi:hypothetical protein
VFCSRVRAAAKHSVLTSTFYRKKNKFLKSGFVRSPAYNKLKTPTKAGGKASHEQRFKTNRQNFGWGQNFAQDKEQEIKRYQGADFDVKIMFIW